jgi:hypothetical protein
MNANNKPFMESYKNSFNTGDIVWWNEWKLVENLGHVATAQYGAIIKIKIKKHIYNERSVYVAEVLPFGQVKTRELSLHLLNKETN